MPDMLDPPVYYVTISRADDEEIRDHWRHESASLFIRRMIDHVNKGERRITVDPATGGSGALRITRTLPAGPRTPEEVKTWSFVPPVRPRLTQAQHDDLVALRDSVFTGWPDGRASYPGGRLRRLDGRGEDDFVLSLSGLDRIGPARWRKLVDRGWVAVHAGIVWDGQPVMLTIAGRVALALAEHMTSPAVPGVSLASCRCGRLQGPACERRYPALSAARAHRAEWIMAALGADEEAARAAGIRAGNLGGSQPADGVRAR